MASPPGSPAGGIQRPMSAMIRPNRSSSRMSMSSKHGGGSRASDEESKTAVKVAVRVRPPLKPEDPGYDLIPQRFRTPKAHVTSSSSLQVDAASGGKKVFVFDRVFGEDCDQDGVFEYVLDSVNSFVQGYNVSILAYGQSGAGKSYTMGTTGPGEQADAKIMGIIPRAAAALFDKLEGSGLRNGSGIRAPSRISGIGMQSFARSSANKNWQMKATYVEIYNEQLRDLLLPDSTPAHERPAVTIRENQKGRILLTGLNEVPINSVDDLLNALNFGSAIRQTDATAVNAKSSRSHAVFSLNLVQKKSSSPPKTTTREKRMSVPIEAMSGSAGSESWVTVDSKLHFVDLAGSERLKNTQAQGERAKEGISINAGLASLGKVISQLSIQKHGHVSYRDSKLTRLLQDSLGGQAITYMIACINPADFHLSETLNTVQYAQRARAIQIKPQIQQVSDDSDKQAVIERLRAEVQFLRDQIRLSERTERKRGAPQEQTQRQDEREIELHNQVLDIQENYNALSARHAKLISEITKARDSDSADTPLLKESIGDSALERLKRSNTFAEAVDAVVLEYEKTIQNLESSLSNTRSTLSTNESELLEKETRIAILESSNQQLQARIQKAVDREASNEDYVKSLEAQIDNSVSGIERNDTTISDLRDKLQKARENESSAEEYISTLEERLAENEQEVELMQREIERLKHVVERQRSIGKLDNLLYELDNIRDAKTDEPLVNGHSKKNSDPFVEKRSSGGSNRQFNTNVDPIAEEEGGSRPATAGAEPPTTADDTQHHAEGDELIEGSEVQEAPGVSTNGLAPEEAADTPQSPAQSKYVHDKLESVTEELFDLRVEHENTVQEYDRLASKYQEALRTLAALQDTVDEARHRRPSLTSSTRPTSFLADAGVNGLRGEDGHPSSSRTLSSELSSAEYSANTSYPDEENYTPTENSDAETAQAKLGSTEESHPLRNGTLLADELESLKKLNEEKEQRMAELNQNYADLHAQHQDTLDYVEELKTEVTKAQMARPSSPNAQIIRRKSSQNVIANDRSNRAFASLRNMALENFEEQPDTIQNFELNLNAIMTELHMRSERVQALENEVSSVRKEMEGKMTLITGLTKERSSLKSSPLDISIVASMQDQIKQSEDQLKDLQDAHLQREQELQEQIESLKALQTGSLHEGPPSPRQVAPAVSHTLDEDADDAEQHSELARLRKEAAEWQSKHLEAIENTKATEKRHLDTVQELEVAMKKLDTDYTARISELEQTRSADTDAQLETERLKHAEVIATLQSQVDEHKATAANNANRLAELEESHTSILQQVEANAEARELTEKQLETHKSLVSNLEKQIEEHKAAVDSHQQGMDALKQEHASELDKLAAELADHQKTSQSLQGDLTNAKADIDGLLKGLSTALNEDTDLNKVHSQIGALVEQRQALSTKMDKAVKDLEQARADLVESSETIQVLRKNMREFEVINTETLAELQRVSEKERKSSRLVQELEDQLNQNYDQHEAANNRLSALQTERSREFQDVLHRKDDLEKEVEESRIKVALLESQLADAKLGSGYRESIDPRESLQRSNSNNSNLRKSTSHNSLPSPPPAIPLPPLPGSPPPTQTNAPSPPNSRHQSKDIAQAQLVEDQEARIRTIEKHLFAEKQLTATLEDALTDLESSSQKTKSDLEGWKKKCATLEQEMDVMKKERSMARHSLQAVEEERNARLRVEAERAHLEARMQALNNSNKKNKKKSTLNCF
ncbi:kinesin [Lophiotrema nucula]|uniref:Kinesin n=1 Tax=Lophiotrema nucula TaxID=690887 RepID=A0A6A5ZQZ0_9PLEO|nr:kinesin [Lophiotrema nucula]